MKISVALPSRGLIYVDVEQALSNNLQGYDYRIYRSSNLKIPDGHNILTEMALGDNPDYVLYVEEDTVMPDGAIDDLVMAKADIACIDYSVNGWGCITRTKDTKEILWCGLGCTLVKKEVFKKLDKPYFRSDKALLLNDWPKIQWIDAGGQAYGGQDIWFCMQARLAGFKITQVKGECKHLTLASLGRREINNGLHLIAQKPKIEKYQEL